MPHCCGRGARLCNPLVAAILIGKTTKNAPVQEEEDMNAGALANLFNATA